MTRQAGSVVKRGRLLIMCGLLLFSLDRQVHADWQDARCDIYSPGSNHADKVIKCVFSQRQGYMTIHRSDGVIHDLAPIENKEGRYTDQKGEEVRVSYDLGDQGLILTFNDASIYVLWHTPEVSPTDSNHDNWTAPFSTDNYDATTRLPCRKRSDTEFGSCPAGILRMEDRQASIVVLSPNGEIFTIHKFHDNLYQCHESRG